MSLRLLALTWQYCLASAAQKVQTKVLADHQTPPVVRQFLTKGSQPPLEYYFRHRLWQVNSIEDPEENERRMEYDTKKQVAALALRQLGLSVAEVTFWETIALSVWPAQINPLGEDENEVLYQVVQHYYSGFLRQLAAACQRHSLETESELLHQIIAWVRTHEEALSE